MHLFEDFPYKLAAIVWRPFLSHSIWNFFYTVLLIQNELLNFTLASGSSLKHSRGDFQFGSGGSDTIFEYNSLFGHVCCLLFYFYCNSNTLQVKECDRAITLFLTFFPLFPSQVFFALPLLAYKSPTTNILLSPTHERLHACSFFDYDYHYIIGLRFFLVWMTRVSPTNVFCLTMILMLFHFFSLSNISNYSRQYIILKF